MRLVVPGIQRRCLVHTHMGEAARELLGFGKAIVLLCLQHKLPGDDIFNEAKEEYVALTGYLD